MIKYFKIGMICFISGGLLALILVKKYWPTKEIEIVEKKVEKTVWKTKIKYVDNKPEFSEENFETAVKCSESPIKVDTNIKDNVVSGKAYDDCKYADFKITLKAKETFKHTLQFGYLSQLKTGQSWEFSYLYNLSLFSLGIGVILNKNYPGIKVIIQKSF
jgi:hypothetical protein